MKRNYTLNENFEFTYALTELDTITTVNYLDAIDKSSLLVYKDAESNNLSKFGLCLSGMDSELIARSFYKLGLPVEYFFLRIDDININELILCEQIAKKYNTKLNTVFISKEELLETVIYENFIITHVLYPTYVTLPFLIKNIPDHFYIIIGEGDVEKGWPRYKIIFDEKIPKPDHDNFFYIPEHLTEISYDLSINYFKKKGEGNFYSRCFDVWYHILRDSNLIIDSGCLFNPKKNILSTLAKSCDLLSPTKTMNFENHNELANLIKKKLFDYGKKIKSWKHTIGDVIILDKKLIFPIR